MFFLTTRGKNDKPLFYKYVDFMAATATLQDTGCFHGATPATDWQAKRLNGPLSNMEQPSFHAAVMADASVEGLFRATLRILREKQRGCSELRNAYCLRVLAYVLTF